MYRFHWSDEFQKTGMAKMKKALTDCWNGQETEYDCIGQARTGDVCFDIVIRTERDSKPIIKAILCFDLYVGGIDSGYGYSAEDAMATGLYKTKHDVPDDLLYPYDERDGFGGPLKDYVGMSFEEFVERAEAEMASYIINDRANDKAVQEAASRPFHYW